MVGSEYLPTELSNERIQSEDSLSISLAVKIIRYLRGDLLITSNRKRTIHTITVPLTEKRIYEKTA